jgi:hypothetical protein
MKQGDLPFTKENRPWLTPDCIEAMNMQWISCMSKIPEESREALGAWAAVKVEMHHSHERPDIHDKCDDYAESHIGEQVRKIEESFRWHHGHHPK